MGKKAMEYWENEMILKNHKILMTSTLISEDSQHFYRKLGYTDCGCLVKNILPLIESMEVFMIKKLD